MNSHEYKYIGEPIPKINNIEHKEFILNFQKSMLLSLSERKLLTNDQAERVFNILLSKSIGKHYK